MKNRFFYVSKIYQKYRIFFYTFLSSQKINAIKRQPILIEGKGTITLGKNVTFGVKKSPFFFSGYTYIESRSEDSSISIGSNSFINNSATIISNGASIVIGEKCLIGFNFQVLDSDFHNIEPSKRFVSAGGSPVNKDVFIGDNVFIGNDVTVLKGVRIGNNSVIANGSIVVKDIPSNVIAGGNIAKVIRDI